MSQPIEEPEERDQGPTEQQIIDWGIHNDHADGVIDDQQEE
jgi:hypothetical protein